MKGEFASVRPTTSKDLIATVGATGLHLRARRVGNLRAIPCSALERVKLCLRVLMLSIGKERSVAERARAELATAAHDAHHTAAAAGRAVLCGSGSVGGRRSRQDCAELARSDGNGATRGDPARQLAIVKNVQADILQLLLFSRWEVPPCRTNSVPTVTLQYFFIYKGTCICITFFCTYFHILTEN